MIIAEAPWYGENVKYDTNCIVIFSHLEMGQVNWYFSFFTVWDMRFSCWHYGEYCLLGSLVDAHHRFKEIYCLHLQCWRLIQTTQHHIQKTILFLSVINMCLQCNYPPFPWIPGTVSLITLKCVLFNFMVIPNCNIDVTESKAAFINHFNVWVK